MRWESTDRNPARSAKPPTLTRQTIVATSPEAVAKVIAAARVYSDALGLYLWLVMVTGVRRGELCGLQIRDVDLDRGLVHVAFNYVVRAGQRIRKDTETHQDRWLAIDPVTCALIAGYLAEIKAELAAVGVELRDDAYLFSNDPAHARPWNPNWVTHRSLTSRTRPGWSSTSRAAGITPRASSWPAGSTCGTLPHGSATAAAARPRCGTTPTRSRGRPARRRLPRPAAPAPGCRGVFLNPSTLPLEAGYTGSRVTRGGRQPVRPVQRRWRPCGLGSARGPASRAGPGPGSPPARAGRLLARRRSERSRRAHASVVAILARSSCSAITLLRAA